jgi:Leucine-rich repeat (LRR) protein
LSTLIMTDNLLKEINLSTNLKRLKIVDFAGNQINKISEDIFLLKTLQKIDLHDNQIEEIPREIFVMPFLLEIILKGNQLDSRTRELYESFNLRHTGQELTP